MHGNGSGQRTKRNKKYKSYKNNNKTCKISVNNNANKSDFIPSMVKSKLKQKKKRFAENHIFRAIQIYATIPIVLSIKSDFIYA